MPRIVIPDSIQHALKQMSRGGDGSRMYILHPFMRADSPEYGGINVMDATISHPEIAWSLIKVQAYISHNSKSIDHCLIRSKRGIIDIRGKSAESLFNAYALTIAKEDMPPCLTRSSM